MTPTATMEELQAETSVLTLTKHTREDQAVQQYTYDPEVIDRAVMLGDMKKMDERTRLAFYRAVCLSVGLNPLTQPFTPLERQDKTVWLYANSSCTQQLAKLHNVGFREMEREHMTILDEPLYLVRVVAYTPDGRAVPSQAVVSLTKKKKTAKGTWPDGNPKFVDALDADGEPILVPLRGESLANAMMRGDTKCLRRATLALIGLGWMQADHEGKTVVLNMQTGELTEGSALRPTLLEDPREQAKGLAEHVSDLFGDPIPGTAVLHPAWGQIERWYAAAGRQEQYAELCTWACKRYKVADVAEMSSGEVEALAQRIHTALEPLIQTRAAAAPEADAAEEAVVDPVTREPGDDEEDPADLWEREDAAPRSAK